MYARLFGNTEYLGEDAGLCRKLEYMAAFRNIKACKGICLECVGVCGSMQE